MPLPTESGREAILRTLTRGKPVAGEVDLAAVARDPAAAAFSGADLDFLVREACMPAVLVRLRGCAHAFIWHWLALHPMLVPPPTRVHKRSVLHDNFFAVCTCSNAGAAHR